MAAGKTPPPGGARITVVLNDCAPSVAVTGARTMVFTLEAVTLKLALIPPAGTLTEAGVLMFGLELERLNAILAAAGADSVSVHVATPGVRKPCGVHTRPFRREGWAIVMTAARPRIGIGSPDADAPSVSVTPMLETASGVAGASFTVTRATTPSLRTPPV